MARPGIYVVFSVLPRDDGSASISFVGGPTAFLQVEAPEPFARHAEVGRHAVVQERGGEMVMSWQAASVDGYDPLDLGAPE